jgi:DNA-binding MarR family transcriptional regulator
MTSDRGTDRSEALEQLGRSFKAAMAAVRRLRGRETHRSGELSFAQYSLLFGLGEGGELSAGELALAADVSAATVTQMLDSLAAAGLVRRVRSERDKRVVLTSLTARGSRLVAERRAHFQPRWRRALATFSDDELLTAAAVLDRLRDTFYDVAHDQELPGAGPLPTVPRGVAATSSTGRRT